MATKPIAISAGHYPDRQGAYNKTYGIHEHEMCYEIALDVTNELDKLSIPVIFVPTGTLTKKIAFINSKSPLCAVEIHLNSFVQLASGTECLYYLRSEKGKSLATFLQGNLVDNLHLQDRGIVARKDLIFLSRTHCPSVITESLFLNNDKEVEQYLLSTQGKEYIVNGHVCGIKAYYEKES